MNLLAFCSTDDPRPYLLKPIRGNGFLYATNGHLFVRIDDDKTVEVADWYAEDICRALDEHIKSANLESLIDVSLLDIPEPKKCNCGDLDWREEDCDDCDGVGRFYHGEHEYECKECDGTGSISVKTMLCHTCNNTHTLPDFVKIGESQFNAKYVRLIATLPNVKISTLPVGNRHDFVFDGGQGCICILWDFKNET